ncbi:hypothetical protein ACI3KW_05695 [Devosia sp. ZW T5_3]|uniref:hypothetical protein n=1 Tax=Devosia sp. ZW T5_3 TaxID=3378085 RepID=UPI003852256C
MNIENDSPRHIDGEMTPPPFQAGDDMDGQIVQSTECLADGVWFFGIEDQGFIWISPESVAKIPERWRSGSPYVQTFSSVQDGWIDWYLPKPRRRRKAVA